MDEMNLVNPHTAILLSCIATLIGFSVDTAHGWAFANLISLLFFISFMFLDYILRDTYECPWFAYQALVGGLDCEFFVPDYPFKQSILSSYEEQIVLKYNDLSKYFAQHESEYGKASEKKLCF